MVSVPFLVVAALCYHHSTLYPAGSLRDDFMSRCQAGFSQTAPSPTIQRSPYATAQGQVPNGGNGATQRSPTVTVQNPVPNGGNAGHAQTPGEEEYAGIGHVHKYMAAR